MALEAVQRRGTERPAKKDTSSTVFGAQTDTLGGGFVCKEFQKHSKGGETPKTKGENCLTAKETQSPDSYRAPGTFRARSHARGGAASAENRAAKRPN